MQDRTQTRPPTESRSIPCRRCNRLDLDHLIVPHSHRAACRFREHSGHVNRFGFVLHLEGDEAGSAGEREDMLEMLAGDHGRITVKTVHYGAPRAWPSVRPAT